MELTQQERAVFAAIDEYREEAIGFLQTLIRTPSVTGEEGDIQGLMQQKFEAMGLEVERFVPDLELLKDHPEFIPGGGTGQPLSERPNVIGKLDGEGGGPSVLVFGHVDTVPPGPLDEWKHDPFGAEVDDGKMYGRGTADMKGGLAASFMAIDFLQRLGVRLKGDVVCMTNIEEEIGGSGGVLACVVQGDVSADVAIYPHPGAEKPSVLTTGSSGAFGFRIHVKGEAMHGMQSHLGVNAIEKAMLVFNALKNLDVERGRMVHDEMTERYYSLSGRAPRSTNLYLSALRGGDWIYQVPASCEMDWMFTFAHKESMQEMQSLIAETVRHASEADPWLSEHPAEVEWLPLKFSPSPPFPDHPFMRLVQDATETVTNRPAQIVVNPVGSDIRVTVNQGQMPTAILGPTGDKLHAYDEWVDLQTYVETIKNSALVLMRWCGTA